MIPDLQSTRQAFAYWRSSRDKRGATPMALRQMAVELIDHYPLTRIVSALGINTKALNDWARERASDAESTSLEFVPLNITNATLAPETPSIRLHVSPDNGLVFEGDVHALVQVAQQLRGQHA